MVVRSVEQKGWVRDQPDHRDLMFHERVSIKAVSEVPTSFSLAEHMPGIYDQLQLGSCVGNGVARVMEYTEGVQGEGSVTPSRLFIYGNARKLEGTYESDSGAQIRDGIKGVATWGAPPEAIWPYSDTKPGPFNENIPDTVYAAGAREQAISYSRIIVGTPGAPMRTAISTGRPIVFGFSVPSYFEDGTWDPASGEPLPLPKQTDGFVGGHCVVVSGYNFTGQFISTPTTNRYVPACFECDNSWGSTWGMGGRFNMDARWFTPHGTDTLATDLWVVERVS